MLTVLTLPPAPRQAGWRIENAISRSAGTKLSDLSRLVDFLGADGILRTHRALIDSKAALPMESLYGIFIRRKRINYCLVYISC